MILSTIKPVDLTELNRLEWYLQDHGIKYDRIDQKRTALLTERHQLIVYDANGDRAWDAICHWGSYGCAQGLLEIYGAIVNIEVDGDSVVGYLTADDVIKRCERWLT